MEGGQDHNTSNDFSPTFYMNYGSHPHIQTSNAVPVTELFAHPISMAWPTQSAAATVAAAVANNQSHTPFQDLLADAMAEQNVNPFQNLHAEGGSTLPPHPMIRPSSFPFQQQAGSSSNNVPHQDIDLNHEATENHEIDLNQRRGYVVVERNHPDENIGEVRRADGRRFSCKRRAPEGSESTDSMGGESSRTRSMSDDDDDDDYDEDCDSGTDSDGNYVPRRLHAGSRVRNSHNHNHYHNHNYQQQQEQQQQYGPSGSGSVIIGLSVPTAAQHEENALRNRIMARARQMAEDGNRVRRHIRLRRSAHPGNFSPLWLQQQQQQQLQQLQQQQPQQPPPPAVAFPFEHQAVHPGAIQSMSPSPPPMQLPVPPLVVPNFAHFADSSHQPFQWTNNGNNNNNNNNNFNRQAAARPTGSPLVSATTTYTLNGGETVTVPLETNVASSSRPRNILLPHEMMQRANLEQMLTSLNVLPVPNSTGSNIASSSNSNNSAGMMPPHAVHMDHQGNLIDQFGQRIPIENAISEAQARANYCLQHLGIPVNGRVRDIVMRGGHGHMPPTHQSIGSAVTIIPPSRQTVQNELAMRALAQRRSRLVSEVRNALALVRRGGSMPLEDVMIIESILNDGDALQDMRLDIDEMTYEDLLELEERIGNVSTGLSDSAIHSHMKHCKYQAVTFASSSQHEPCCCICQEEYMDGEDLGKLDCGHAFHYNCIKQWLSQKNNCPVCKMTALHF